MAFHLCPPFVPLILGDTKFFRKFVDWRTKYLVKSPNLLFFLLLTCRKSVETLAIFRK